MTSLRSVMPRFVTRALTILTALWVTMFWIIATEGLFGQSQRGQGDEVSRVAPPRDERQLPLAMHSRMKDRPLVKVGQSGGDLMGVDHRVLQAAVDYVGHLGGGTVEIGPGRYLMRDSLHLRAHVTVRGHGDDTVLVKAPGVVSALALDGDFGEEQVTVADATGFEIGDGVAVRDSPSGGFHTTVARITGKTGNTFSISRPLNADCLVSREARAATVFPVISGYEIEVARVESLTVEGSRDENIHLNGCRGAGIFLYRAFGTVIRSCKVRNYNGDGISFQQSNDVQVLDCVSENNSQLGLHPGSGSQRPRVSGCIARGNGTDGLFLCWRVRHGIFENNQLVGNGRFGISIGHKDTDNLLEKNVVRDNARHGVVFRKESYGMSGHRNRLIGNLIENNGVKEGKRGAGILIEGETEGVVIRGNVIRDTRSGEDATQRTAIRLERKVGEVVIEKNEIDAEIGTEDLRRRD